MAAVGEFTRIDWDKMTVSVRAADLRLNPAQPAQWIIVISGRSISVFGKQWHPADDGSRWEKTMLLLLKLLDVKIVWKTVLLINYNTGLILSLLHQPIILIMWLLDDHFDHVCITVKDDYIIICFTQWTGLSKNRVLFSPLCVCVCVCVQYNSTTHLHMFTKLGGDITLEGFFRLLTVGDDWSKVKVNNSSKNTFYKISDITWQATSW